MNNANLLIVEDESLIAEDIGSSLVQMGYPPPRMAVRGDEAIRMADECRPDLVLMDVVLPGEIDGIETARRIRSRFDVPIIYISAYSEETIMERAKETQPFGYFVKPVSERDLHTTIQMALHRHRLEEALRQSESRYRAIVESQTDLICRFGADYSLSFVNETCCRFLGKDRMELIGGSFLNLALSDERESLADRISSMDRNETATIQVRAVPSSTGEERWLLLSLSRLTDGGDRFVEFQAVGRDITQHVLADKDLARARSFLQSVIDSVSDAIVVIGADYTVSLMNTAARERFMAGESTADALVCCFTINNSNILCPGIELQSTLDNVLKRGEGPLATYHTHTQSDGSEHPTEMLSCPILDESGNIIGAVLVGRDISARQTAEQEQRERAARLFQQQKEQSINTLASGMAHEFNNILTSLMGNTDLLRMRLAHDKEGLELAGVVMKSGERMAHLTRQLLAYARGGKYAPLPVNLSPVISQALDMVLQGENLEELQVTHEVEEELWPVMADLDQMKQALVNVLSNAVEAMNERPAWLGVRAANRYFHENWACSLHHLHQAGAYVQIMISDTGAGIPEDSIERVFDPFFTTKFMGRGLGLAAALGIVQHHGGCIDVRSKAEGGSVFHLYLPKAVIAEETAVPGTRPTKISGDKILVVDDEYNVLDLLNTVFTEDGLEVMTAGGGLEALEIFESNSDDIGIAVVDIQMPDMHGRELYRQMKSIKPDVTVILSSGYDEDTALAGLNIEAGDYFVQKPYRINAILGKVRELRGQGEG